MMPEFDGIDIVLGANNVQHGSHNSVHPCAWGSECEEPGNVAFSVQTRDEDETVLASETCYLCQKHGKRMSYEIQGLVIPEQYLDDFEKPGYERVIEEEP